VQKEGWIKGKAPTMQYMYRLDSLYIQIGLFSVCILYVYHYIVLTYSFPM
jgi:hypothetical protein